MDRAQFGGKAASLAACASHVPVPDGYALDFELVEAVVHGHVLDFDGGPFAVRSSALAEDSETASFAGLFATRLSVGSRADMHEAIRAVHASMSTEAVRAYCARLAIGLPTRMGVIVQRMVDAECSGVMFTRHPLTHADEIVIESTRGTGERLVAGLVEPDRIRVSRGGAILEGAVPYLDRARLDALRDLAARCDAVFGEGHDIEWAFDRDGPWLLQRRPITR
jgi:pyruvate, water dikinase